MSSNLTSYAPTVKNAAERQKRNKNRRHQKEFKKKNIIYNKSNNKSP